MDAIVTSLMTILTERNADVLQALFNVMSITRSRSITNAAG